MSKKLKKSGKNRIMAGVCGGVAEYFKIDPTIVRLILVIVALLKGVGVLLYVIAAIVMPADDTFFEEDENIDNLKSANVDSSENEDTVKNTNNNGKNGRSDEEFDSFFEK